VVVWYIPFYINWQAFFKVVSTTAVTLLIFDLLHKVFFFWYITTMYIHLSMHCQRQKLYLYATNLSLNTFGVGRFSFEWATFLASLGNTITRQLTKLENCSNPLKMWEVF